MNTDFMITDNKAIVFTDNKGKIERCATDNIEDILVCENNIEEIENYLHQNSNELISLENKMAFNYGSIASVAFWVSCGVFTICIIGQPWISIIPFLCGAGLSAMFLSDIKKNLKLIKAKKCVIKELENNLQSEKEKLNELNNDKSNNLINNMKYVKPICQTKEIYNLKNKLRVIQYYQTNKSKVIKAYKNGNLRQLTAISLFSYNDNILLEELIKNDLNKENIKENSKQKILEKK